jgi:hypothetical protein
MTVPTMANLNPVIAAIGNADPLAFENLYQCCQVIGLEMNHFYNLCANGILALKDFCTIRMSHINEMAKRAQSLTEAQFGCQYGVIHVRKLEALWWWVNDRRRRGLELDYTQFTQDVLLQCVERLNVEAQLKDQDSSEVKAPGKFESSHLGWTKWKTGFLNYMRSIKGAQGVPLQYIAMDREDLDNRTFEDNEEELLYLAPLNGIAFESDNKTFYLQLKQATVGTDAWEWIKRFDTQQNGRLAWFQLLNHYDGPGMVKKRIAYATQQVQTLHYKSEQTYPFEKFVTQLQSAYQILEENGESKTESAKITELTKKIQNNHNYLQAILGIINTDDRYCDDFTAAVNKISEAIAQIFPSTMSKDRRKISGVQQNRTGRGGNRGGRGGGRGTNNNNRYNTNTKVNGVDVGEVNKYFPKDQWDKLPASVKADINSRRPPKDQRNKRTIAATGTYTQQQSTNRNNSTPQTEAADPASTTQNETNNVNASGSGGSFGRNGYNNKKQKTD